MQIYCYFKNKRCLQSLSGDEAIAEVQSKSGLCEAVLRLQAQQLSPSAQELVALMTKPSQPSSSV